MVTFVGLRKGIFQCTACVVMEWGSITCNAHLDPSIPGIFEIKPWWLNQSILSVNYLGTVLIWATEELLATCKEGLRVKQLSLSSYSIWPKVH
jgi:hypothetical protein